MNYSHEFFNDCLTMLKNNIIAGIQVTIEDLKNHRRMGKYFHSENKLSIPAGTAYEVWVQDCNRVLWVGENEVGLQTKDMENQFETQLEDLTEAELIEILRVLQSIS